MKTSFCMLLFFVATYGFSQEREAKQKNKLEAHASFSINSNGFAPIPSFSLDKPAFIGSVNLVKGRFSYDPTLGYSLEMKPWFIDNWFHYRAIVRPKFELMAGVNFSTFVSEMELNESEMMKAERYFAFALAGTYKFSPVSSLMLDYWNDKGQEPGTISGHYVSLVFDRSEMRFGKKAVLGITLNLFYINYTGDNDGLFVSPSVSFSVRNIPVALFFQATQAIQSNISPWPGFKWNVGICYQL